MQNDENDRGTPDRQRWVRMVPLALSGIAILVSLATAIWSSYVTEWTSSGDYLAAEQVKSDTAALHSSLKSILDKWVLRAGQDATVAFSREQEAIAEFSVSATAFAYRTWICEEQKTSWNFFFNYLALLSNSSSTPEWSYAIDVLLLLESLSDQDIEAILEPNTNLVKSIADERTVCDPLHKVLIDRWRAQDEETPRLLQCLFDHGINDPDLDFLVGSTRGDLPLVGEALESGADRGMTTDEVMARYRDDLRSFGCT